ncbi:putative calcium-transporting ATPase 13, plasma membrane-type [Camellia lanceoleosa]|uniref:Calcium-transporting ATPase 13, plasma membrane-type n=1 Tax=Camellia lanceoleosa TaxID=1840588 RepID=A0ACC0HFQ5_9ERIC|nr:putative calcium-transporting ATPase 13, plasma membrane-type [Camellia lanceoleosa]
MAFATIYCSRAFSASLEANKKRKVSPILPSNPVIVIDVLEPPHPCFSNIDNSSLTQLVNKKNLTQLVEKYDGVEGTKVEQMPLRGWLNKLTSAIGKIVQYFIYVVGIVADAVTIVGVAIPKSLPLAVTLTLAYSMKRMMANQAMVHKVSAYETMGLATDICTVKMGTLTLNQM